jgi:hypothetical protein
VRLLRPVPGWFDELLDGWQHRPRQVVVPGRDRLAVEAGTSQASAAGVNLAQRARRSRIVSTAPRLTRWAFGAW